MRKSLLVRLLFTLLCLALCTGAAMAQAPYPPGILLYTTGSPAYAPGSLTGTLLTQRFGDETVDGSFQCVYHDCDISGFSFYAFLGTGGLPDIGNINFLFGSVPFNLKVPADQTGTARVMLNSCVAPQCQFSIVLPTPVDLNKGTYWLNLWGATFPQDVSGAINWSDAVFGSMQPSSTLVLDKGVISGYPDAKTINVYGEPTTVPEPSSMLLLGSGVLGLVGVLRRKLMR